MTVAVVHTFGSPCRCHAAILGALRAAGLEAREIDADSLPQDVSALAGCRFAFDQTDSYRGDGFRYPVAEALQTAGLEVIGSPPEVGRLLDDKRRAREELERVGLPVAPLATGWPRVVKAAGVHGSRAVRLVRTPEEQARAIAECGPSAFAEEYVAGREVAVGIVGRKRPRVLPPVEIRIPGEIYTREDKWGEVNPAVVRAEVSPDLSSRLLAAYSALGLRDFARFDSRVRPDGSWIVLEVNVRPSLEPDGLLAIAAGLEGISPARLILSLLAEAGCSS